MAAGQKLNADIYESVNERTMSHGQELLQESRSFVRSGFDSFGKIKLLIGNMNKMYIKIDRARRINHLNLPELNEHLKKIENFQDTCRSLDKMENTFTRDIDTVHDKFGSNRKTVRNYHLLGRNVIAAVLSATLIPIIFAAITCFSNHSCYYRTTGIFAIILMLVLCVSFAALGTGSLVLQDSCQWVGESPNRNVRNEVVNVIEAVVNRKQDVSKKEIVKFVEYVFDEEAKTMPLFRFENKTRQKEVEFQERIDSFAQDWKYRYPHGHTFADGRFNMDREIGKLTRNVTGLRGNITELFVLLSRTKFIGKYFDLLDDDVCVQTLPQIAWLTDVTLIMTIMLLSLCMLSRCSRDAIKFHEDEAWLVAKVMKDEVEEHVTLDVENVEKKDSFSL